MDKYLSRTAWDGALLPEPVPEKVPDNFWAPWPYDRGAHGPFDHEAKRHSSQLWVTSHRAGVIVGVALALVASLAGLTKTGRRLVRVLASTSREFARTSA
jgi:hypothetical protein